MRCHITPPDRRLSDEEFAAIITTLDRLPGELEQLIRARTGRPRTLGLRPYLGGLLIEGIHQGHQMHLKRAAHNLATLAVERRRQLHVPPQLSEKRIACAMYSTNNALAKALRAAPTLTVHDEKITVDIGTFMNLLIDAGLPDDLPVSKSIAVDATAVETWASHWPRTPILADGPTDQDPAAPALKEDKLPLGPDGRRVYTLDPDARGGHRSATNKRTAGPYIGYALDLAVQVPDLKRRGMRTRHGPGNLGTVDLGPTVPLLIVAATIKSAGAHPHDHTVSALLKLKRRRDFTDLVWDRGYSQLLPQTGYFPLRAAGIKVIHDFRGVDRGIRPFRTPDLLIDGHLYSRHLPEHLRGVRRKNGHYEPLAAPPRMATAIERHKIHHTYDLRARWQLVLWQTYPDGTTRWKCPFHAKKLKSKNFPYTKRYEHSVPTADPLFDPNAKKCCDGVLTVTPAELPRWQPHALYTSDWATSYGRRNLVETANSQIKTHFTSIDGGNHFRVMGREKVGVLLACTITGYNLWHADAWRRKLAEQSAAPKTRRKRRKGTFEDILGNEVDSEDQGAA